MSINAGMLSSATDSWATPQAFFDRLNRTFGFTLDPCADQANAKCSRFFTAAHDGLKQSWAGHRVFMNPPYGREIGRWVAKAAQEARGGGVGGMPAPCPCGYALVASALQGCGYYLFAWAAQIWRQQKQRTVSQRHRHLSRVGG